MEGLFTLLVMVGIVVLFIKIAKRRRETYVDDDEYGEENDEEFLPYRRRQFLMTKAEYAFNKVLEEAVRDKYSISRQVPLANLVEVVDSYKWNKAYRSKIDKKSVDFVVYDKEKYTPVVAIELDDSSHLQPDRIERDRFVDGVLHRAGIRLERIKTGYSYDAHEIAKFL